MNVTVEYTPDATEEVRTVTLWWRQNRPSATNLFREELDTAVEMLSAFPEVGHPRRHREFKGLRRLLLRATRYHLYYVYDGRRIIILSVWSAVRGRGPKLR